MNIVRQYALLLVLIALGSLSTFAEHVDEQTARRVGQHFLMTRVSAQRFAQEPALTLAYAAQVPVQTNDAQQQVAPRTYYYVFNTLAGGFVIVSGDDAVLPVLGYADKGVFDAEKIPNNTRKWLEGYKNQIREVVEHDIPPTKEIAAEWEALRSETVAPSASMPMASVRPLVQTAWDQSPNYNALCPYDNANRERTVTGCVATAMAQIMKYWNYPAKGSGFRSYNHSTYGTISANFGSASYTWNAMTNTLNGPNDAIATLMYHCGVSVDMDYGVAAAGGSAAYVISAQSPVQHCSEYALKTYFGYRSSLRGVERSRYTDAQWIGLLRAELDARRPILYAGFGSGGGHAFVCDGYDNNSFFHFNWGWSGAYDGYFALNALNPDGLGTGGGSGGYNSGHQALVGIEPPPGAQTYNLTLYDFVTPSSARILYGQPFTVETNILNSGTGAFSGDYAVAVFDVEGNFIDYVQIMTGNSLPAGYKYNSNLVFSTSGILSMLPGEYRLGVFFRPAGGNWVMVSNNVSYVNGVTITVINPNDIELHARMTVSPGTALTRGQSMSVNLNVVNTGARTFTGLYAIGLYNLDGTLAQEIGSMTESNGLPPGYTYNPPYLTFTQNVVTANPGTYLLAMLYKPNGGDWQITGSSNHQNPIMVTVKQASLSPDAYEVNNTLAQASTLPLPFTGNSATTTSNGSNMHTGNDNDFYKVVLPAGRSYTITARLHDMYASGNGTVYTGDALFSWSTNGTQWSEIYDDVMSTPIQMPNGGTLYVQVAPYFAGAAGTYMLDLRATRSSTVDVADEVAESDVTVYPNPANDNVNIELSRIQSAVTNVEIVDLRGNVLDRQGITEQTATVSMPVGRYPAGTYLLRIHTANGSITRKISIGGAKTGQ